MGYLNTSNLQPLNEDVRSVFYNLLTRVVLGNPRSVYDMTKRVTYDTIKYLVVALGLAASPFLSTPIFMIVAVCLGVALRICRDVDLPNTLDQTLFRRYYNIDKKMEDKLIKMAGNKGKINTSKLKEMELIYGDKDEAAKYYKSKIQDDTIVEKATHNMAFHVVQRGKIAYIFLFDFDSNAIYKAYSVQFSNPNANKAHYSIKQLHQFDKLNPDTYTIK